MEVTAALHTPRISIYLDTIKGRWWWWWREGGEVKGRLEELLSACLHMLMHECKKKKKKKDKKSRFPVVKKKRNCTVCFIPGKLRVRPRKYRKRNPRAIYSYEIYHIQTMKRWENPDRDLKNHTWTFSLTICLQCWSMPLMKYSV